MPLVSYFLFLINPILGIFNSIWFKSFKNAENLIWIFVVLSSYSFVISSPELDAATRKDIFELIIYQRLSLLETFELFFLESEKSPDFIEYVIYYAVAQFTDSFDILFLVLGVIFGFFYSRSIGFFLKCYCGKYVLISVILVLLFAMINGFWNINAFRFFCAVSMFFYFTINYFVNDRKMYWVLVLCACLHYSTLLPISLFVLYLTFFYKRIGVIYTIFILSFVISFLPVAVFGSILSAIAPDFLASKVMTYTDSDYAASLSKGGTDWSIYIRGFVFFAVNVLMILLYKYARFKVFKANVKYYRFFGFIMFLGASFNALSQLPSGYRFMILYTMFVLFFVFVLLQQTKVFKHKMLIESLKISCGIFVLGIFTYIRIGLDMVNFYLIFGNTIQLVIENEKKALIELFK
ncbi:EpsG family protein [Myroides marinus]|uniref:EpsG family protein n=1 Tax=Myroides marinus TaxID=703342 RepID=UPI002576D977|nr:EpsG family protein [Myroides marinus]MDM1380712.1 EpsG family protein [Myroides marinus]MDM1387974.1 EpsG family protein [Myroides marinus]MDM1395196.1 EpsG family protein [Myroides marinus]